MVRSSTWVDSPQGGVVDDFRCAGAVDVERGVGVGLGGQVADPAGHSIQPGLDAARFGSKLCVDGEVGDEQAGGDESAHGGLARCGHGRAFEVRGQLLDDRWHLMKQEVGSGRLATWCPLGRKQFIEASEELFGDSDSAPLAHPSVAVRRSCPSRSAVAVTWLRNPLGNASRSVTTRCSKAAMRSFGVIASSCAAVRSSALSDMRAGYRVGRGGRR